LRYHRVILNILAAFSALLATALACGFLGTLTLKYAPLVSSSKWYSVLTWLEVENGQLRLFWGRPRPNGNFNEHTGFDFHPSFDRVPHIYWWGFEFESSNIRTGGLNWPPWRVQAILPAWCVLLPSTAFPLWWFGRRLRNRPGGFEIITDQPSKSNL
jgi:hypothetical protein